MSFNLVVIFKPPKGMCCTFAGITGMLDEVTCLWKNNAWNNQDDIVNGALKLWFTNTQAVCVLCQTSFYLCRNLSDWSILWGFDRLRQLLISVIKGLVRKCKHLWLQISNVFTSWVIFPILKQLTAKFTSFSNGLLLLKASNNVLFSPPTFGILIQLASPIHLYILVSHKGWLWAASTPRPIKLTQSIHFEAPSASVVNHGKKLPKWQQWQ